MESNRDSNQIIYIAGPISDDPDYDAKFAAVEDYFAKRGCPALNPARMFAGIAAAGVGYDAIMKYCLALVEQADVIALLPNWYKSEGAIRELMRYCGIHQPGKFLRMDIQPTEQGWQADLIAIDESVCTWTSCPRNEAGMPTSSPSTRA